MKQRLVVLAALASCWVAAAPAMAQQRGADRRWEVVGAQSILKDRAVAAGLMELEAALGKKDRQLARVTERTEGPNAIVLSLRDMPAESADGLSAQEARFIVDSTFALTTTGGPPRSLTVVASSPLGLAYALFHVADRVNVLGDVPELSGTVRPALPYRFVLVSPPVSSSLRGPDVSEEKLESAEAAFEKLAAKSIKHGYNFIIILGGEDYVPWRDATYGPRSERFRQYLARFVDVAHAYHLRFLLMGDEFIYLPELLKRYNTTPSVKNDALWEALAGKYHDLLATCPELDGVATRTGELIPRFAFRGLNLIHSPEPEPDPRIEERYRRFIKTMQGVVAGEFGKFYLHRTWVVNVHEQHSIPHVYARTFTEDVPNENLFISIKLTSGDQWYACEPYNATFGVTPHTTIAQGELYSGYQGGCTFIEYPARYFQAALQWAVDRDTKGTFGSFGPDSLPADAILYAFSRLGWTPMANVDELTQDWAASTFGPEAQQDVAKIFLLGSVAVRDGLYLRQPGLRNWGPIRHVRTNVFVIRGRPLWDKGTGHDQFLKDIYLECKPWIPETFRELNHGVDVTQQMWALFRQCKDKIEDPQKAAELQKLLRHGQAAIRLNRDYVEGFLTYFKYREQPTPEHKAALAAVLDRLRASVADYERDFDHYELRGIPTFMELAQRAVANLDDAERVLREAPTQEQILEMFAERESESARLLRENPDAPRIATWQCTIDGKDLLMIEGDQFRIQHIAHDPINSTSLVLHNEIPKDRPCTIVVKPIEVRGTAHVVEQPSQENGHTITLYLEDRVPGQTIMRFELYAIDPQD